MATPFPATSHSSPVSNPLASSGGGPGRSCLVLRSTTCARTFAEPAAAHHTVGGPWASPRCAVAPRVPPLLVNVHAWSCCAAATNQQPELNAPAWHELSPRKILRAFASPVTVRLFWNRIVGPKDLRRKCSKTAEGIPSTTANHTMD